MAVLNYMNPTSKATLREGINELRRAEGVDGDMSDLGDLAGQMAAHDAVHVLFGCGTSLIAEVRAHMWMLWGTTASMREMHAAANKRSHREVLREIGHWQLLGTWLKALPAFVSIAWKSRRMHRRWPIEQLDAFLDRHLDEVRAEFGIRF